MFNRFTRTATENVGSYTNESTNFAVAGRDLVNGIRTTAHYSLMTAGIAAILGLGALFVKPELADRFKELSPFYESIDVEAQASAEIDYLFQLLEPRQENTSIRNIPFTAASSAALSNASMPHVPASIITADGKAAPSSNQQKRVTEWLARRYRVAKDATHMLVSATYQAAKETKLDPLLILSVMAIESRFNPFAESPVGAQGLMQVMSKVHRDKFEHHGGVHAALNPIANIKVGALILKEYIKRGGSVEAGLKMYVGAAALDTDYGYGAKVLAEYRRLQDVASGKKVSVFSTTARAPQKQPEAEKKSETVLNDTEPVMPDLSGEKA